MITLPFRQSPHGLSIDALYGMIVAQARSRSFYIGYGVPDTVGSRLDMIVLHLVLLLRQIGVAGATASLGQPLFDRFCRDMDDNFREMGVGDLAVPKEMQRVAEAFYGRSKAYEAALAADGIDALAQALARNVYGADEPPLGARRLAAYMREAVRSLAGQDITRGAAPHFPDPEAIAPPGDPARLNA